MALRTAQDHATRQGQATRQTTRLVNAFAG